MDKNLENEINNAMKNAENNVALDATAQVAKVVSAFYMELVKNGVPKVIAVTLTTAFINTYFNR